MVRSLHTSDSCCHFHGLLVTKWLNLILACATCACTIVDVHVYACILEDTNEIVGFTATHSSDVVYFTDDVIQFPNIVTNSGDYYNAETGIFICPRDGMYAFFSTILGAGTDTLAYITLDTTDLVAMRSHSISNSASNLVFTECLGGTKVWVRQAYDYHIVDGYRGTAFSGYLLQRYET